MIDRKGNEVLKGPRCRFDAGRGWVNGVVREVRMSGVWAGNARVDDGAPENDDLHTNGFRTSAWVEPWDIEVLP